MLPFFKAFPCFTILENYYFDMNGKTFGDESFYLFDIFQIITTDYNMGKIMETGINISLYFLFYFYF